MARIAAQASSLVRHRTIGAGELCE